MVYFKQDKKMSDMENSYSFHLVIVPTNHVLTIKCFINESFIRFSVCVLHTLTSAAPALVNEQKYWFPAAKRKISK